MPDVKIEIGFDLSANGIGSYFTLDDTTKGVLDNATFKLAGTVLTDVTQYARTFTTRRGRSRQLDRFTAGAATVVLDNRARTFDPLAGTALTPYAGQIVPRKELRVSVNNLDVFTGQIEDWNLTYQLSGDSIAEAQCSDGFALIANQTLNAGTAAAQSSGARITSYLNALGWPTAQASVATGQATLLADVISENTNGLQYLQKVEASEGGGAALFVNKSGLMTFRDRSQVQTFGGVAFGTGGIPFQAIDVQYGTETLYTEATVTRSSSSTSTIGTATAANATAVTAYGPTTYTVDTLLDSGGQAEQLANWLVGKYSTPQYVVRSITVNLGALSSTQLVQVLGLELADVIQVTWTPNNIGSALSQYLLVDAIEHRADPGQHYVTLSMSAQQVAFQLDSTFFGLLDSNILGL